MPTVAEAKIDLGRRRFLVSGITVAGGLLVGLSLVPLKLASAIREH